MKNKSRIKLLTVVFLVGLIIVVIRLPKIDFSHISPQGFKQWVESLGAWGPLAYIAIYVLRPLILFPAGILSAAAGIIWGPLVGFLYLQIGANISAWGEFFAARYLFRKRAEKYLRGKIEALDKKIERNGFLAVLLIRVIPNVAYDIQNLSLGLTKVKFRDYFLGTLIGIIPGSFAFVFFGASLISILFNPKNIWMIVLAIAIFAGVYFLQKTLRKTKVKLTSAVQPQMST
ncbi:MAG: TVP38/TMEM64 family protein [Candidatus Omnitrophota bacterium]